MSNDERITRHARTSDFCSLILARGLRETTRKRETIGLGISVFVPFRCLPVLVSAAEPKVGGRTPENVQRSTSLRAVWLSEPEANVQVGGQPPSPSLRRAKEDRGRPGNQRSDVRNQTSEVGGRTSEIRDQNFVFFVIFCSKSCLT
jgi:hypothetical protein